MQLINPNEIGTKISTLLVEADKTFISVSPYLDLSSWKKMIKCLEKSSSKIDIFFYYREIKEIDKQLLNRINVKLIHVPNLHAKMYFNEKECIVSSMNLYEFSDLNSIEIATLYSKKEDYHLLFQYFTKYIKSIPNSATPETIRTNSFKKKNPDPIKVVNGHNIYTWNEYKYKDEFLKFEKRLQQEFGKINCVYANGYMYVKYIINGFELFVYENEKLHLKYSTRTDKINKEAWNSIESHLENKLKEIKYTFRKGSDSEDQYRYHTWKFDSTNDLFQSLPIFQNLFGDKNLTQ